ncbi:hypothetical protein NADFUDRAFT_49493 [Nadsonia fulvescens var. elongata DSM 6958]|uniref:Uncharacterized protein n=1 Tax=Nadsonia fulvescens var. elongata DSM 6958 TaxID=857566 RepID=A0A1E3PNP4_9ASCO|nr:hypothetical protein NADFUDRAFT_49493 [Nadsonia fulvescens var. elongata DSM 6958]
MVGLSASYLPLLYLGLDLPRLLNVVLSSDTTVWNIWGKSFQVIKFYILSMFVGHALWWLEDVATLLWGVRVLTPPWEMLESAKAMIQVEETEVAEEVEVAEEGEEAEVLEVLEVVEGRVVEEVEVVEVVEEVEEMEGQEMAMN